MSSAVPELSHGALLSDGLSRLALVQNPLQTDPDASQAVEGPKHSQGVPPGDDRGPHHVSDAPPSPPSATNRMTWNAHIRDGYGFRPTSGVSTPLSTHNADEPTPLPDPNGLGWPGKNEST